MNSVMTPMPPSHCDIERQNIRPRPNEPKSVRMVAPVAVMPDIDSKTASTAASPAIA